jgi:hypothetical protein
MIFQKLVFRLCDRGKIFCNFEATFFRAIFLLVIRHLYLEIPCLADAEFQGLQNTCGRLSFISSSLIAI